MIAWTPLTQIQNEKQIQNRVQHAINIWVGIVMSYIERQQEVEQNGH